MAHDEDLANRIRECLSGVSGLTDKRMFGGLAFLVDGRMAVAASGHGGLMVRVDPAESEALLEDGVAARMVMQGRPMNGWLLVPAETLDDDDLARWVGIGRRYVEGLPPKQPR